EVQEKTTSEISKLLKGQANTSLKLTIKRYGVDDQLELNLTREKITIDNVPYYGMVSEDVGYIKLSDFTTNAGKEVKNALLELKNEGATSIILDLRDNPGGLLNEAVNVSNVFIPKGSEVVSTRGKVRDWNKIYKALNIPVDNEIPVVVITNSRSASAAEIVAGVIQDYDRGVLVGQKTFGKGLVQATRPLTYNAQLKVTTAKYYTPSGRCIQAIDYSNRNEDGSVGKIPDSLKVAFQTTNGRTVYDGGGVDPDITTELEHLAPITVSLIFKSIIFDYGTEYHFEHESIPDAVDFSISDEEFDDFVTWLSDKDFDYTTKVENSMEKLESLAKQEKHYQEIKNEIENLKNKVKHNKVADLITFRAEIKEVLEEEIASRYYFQEGIIEASFDQDKDVQRAIQVLHNQEEYKSLLVKN
ncbi:MAG: S41 family peptidase, partial [Bacteroidetes bacterium]|nr:S41 family peptidase [Bacteroidota bacterium]